jgi:YVTN family beta-propeller protein
LVLLVIIIAVILAISLVNSVTIRSDTVVATIPTLSGPGAIAFDSANGNIYVANFAFGAGRHTVSVINGSTNKVIATLPGIYNPQGVAVDPVSGRVFVTQLGGYDISVIEGSAVVATSVAQGSQGIVFNSANGYIYAGYFDPYTANPAVSGKVLVINGSTYKVIATVYAVDGPWGIAFDPSDGVVYVCNSYNNTVTVINGSTNKAIATVQVGSDPTEVVFDSSNGDLYVTNSGSNTVSVIDGSTNIVVATIAVKLDPWGIAFDSVNGDVYVANLASSGVSGTVSVIDGSTNTVVAEVKVGAYPKGIAFDSANGDIYVTNYGGDSVSVIRTSFAHRYPYLPLAVAISAIIVVLYYAVARRHRGRSEVSVETQIEGSNQRLRSL